MRIGLVTGEYPPMQGGVGAYTRVLAQTLVKKGHDIFIFSDAQADDPTLSITKTDKGWGLSTMRMINRWAHHSQLDVVNLQFETAAFQMSPWVHFLPEFLRDTPLVTTFHDLLVPYLFPKAGRLRQWIVRRLAKRSHGVIVTNQEDFQQVQHLMHAVLIPIGSNIPNKLPSNYQRDEWRKKAGATPRDFLVAYFGFINHSKGVDILIEDVAHIKKTSQVPIKVVLIGGRTGSSDPSNQEEAQKIDRLIEQHNIQDIITWTGFVDDEAVSAYLTASDVVALPFRDGASYRRGSLMAAIQHGCAIVTTRPKVNIPLFKNGENMLLVQQEILDEDCPPYLHISHALLQLYRHPSLLHKLKQGARDLAHEFNWSVIADDCLAMYEAVLNSRQSTSSH